MEVQGQLSDCVLRSRLYDYNRGASPLKQGSKCRDALLLGHMILKDRGKQNLAGIPRVRLMDYLKSLKCTADQTEKQTQ